MLRAAELHYTGKVSRFWLTFLYIVFFLRFCSYFREDLTSRSSVSTISEPSSYSTGLAPSVMSYLLGITAGKRAAGKIEAQELGLPVESTGLVLPCGSSARFIAEE